MILQNLLLRSPFVKPIDTTGIYDNNTAHAVASYQKGNHLPRYSNNPRGGWVLDISLGGEARCGPAPHTLTSFKTKIADFLTLFKTEFRFLIPCLRHLTRNHTLCKTIINIETLSYLIH